MAMRAYIVAYTYTELLDFAGPVQTWLRDLTGWGYGDDWFPPIRSLPGAVVMLTPVLSPYVYLLTGTAFLGQSLCVLEVSRTLGNGLWRTFFTVALPLAWPAIVAGLSLALMEMLALVLGYGRRLDPSVGVASAARMAGTGYAAPGTLIAVGFIIPFAWLDNGLDTWMRATFGVSTGLLLSGSLAALVFWDAPCRNSLRFKGSASPTAAGPSSTTTSLPSGAAVRCLVPSQHGPAVGERVGIRQEPAALVAFPADV